MYVYLRFTKHIFIYYLAQLLQSWAFKEKTQTQHRFFLQNFTFDIASENVIGTKDLM